VSIQSANDDENDKAIARAWGRLIAALLNMFSSAFNVVGSFFDITREVLKATILGVQRGYPFTSPPIDGVSRGSGLAI
jgi:hypothetical protein